MKRALSLLMHRAAWWLDRRADDVWSVDEILKCPSCDHQWHNGRPCNAPITTTIRDDIGFFAPPSGQEFILLDRTCACGRYDVCYVCQQRIELRINPLDDAAFWCHSYDQRDADPPHTPQPSYIGMGVYKP